MLGSQEPLGKATGADLTTLRNKWVIIPTSLFGRMKARKMLKLSDEMLIDTLLSYTRQDETGDGYEAADGVGRSIKINLTVG